MSTIICESWEIFSSKLRTVIFCKKLGLSTFSSTRRMSIGKKIPISDFNADLNFDNKLLKIEQRSWKIVITDSALFFSNDKQRYCLMALRNLNKGKRETLRHLNFITEIWESSCDKSKPRNETTTVSNKTNNGQLTGLPTAKKIN